MSFWFSQISFPRRANWALAIAALTGPGSVAAEVRATKDAREIILAVDISGSMRMEDFFRDDERTNRLEAIRPALVACISRHAGDRIGLVIFAGEARLLTPCSREHRQLLADVQTLDFILTKDGTAIGDAIGVALKHFAEAEDRGKAPTIILLSDGLDNRSTLSPGEAKAQAASMGVTIHTIGIGTEGLAPIPVFDDAGKKLGYRRALSDLDVRELTAIAKATGGRFFRARDTESIAIALNLLDRIQDRDAASKQHDAAADAPAQPTAGILTTTTLRPGSEAPSS